MSERCRNSRDPFEDYRDLSEFGFGPGPVAPGNEHAPPSEGGVYRGISAPVVPTRSDDLSVRVRQARWRRGDPPRGAPGTRVR
jgi:hypothetical protein